MSDRVKDVQAVADLVSTGEELARIVQQSVPESHHRLCATAQDGECDCYMRRYSEERAALESWQEAMKCAEPWAT